MSYRLYWNVDPLLLFHSFEWTMSGCKYKCCNTIHDSRPIISEYLKALNWNFSILLLEPIWLYKLYLNNLKLGKNNDFMIIYQKMATLLKKKPVIGAISAISNCTFKDVEFYNGMVILKFRFHSHYICFVMPVGFFGRCSLFWKYWLGVGKFHLAGFRISGFKDNNLSARSVRNFQSIIADTAIATLYISMPFHFVYTATYRMIEK